MQPFLESLIPVVLSLIGSVLTWALARAALAVRERFGAATEQILREELHKALQRAVIMAEGKTAQGGTVSPGSVADYILETMPGTIKRLGASRDALVKRAEAEIAVLARPLEF